MPLNPDEILARFGGTTINDLNNVLDVSEDANPDDDISTLSLTQFLANHELSNYLKSHKNEFTILSLNVQSIRAKFDQLSVVLSTLYNEGLSFSVICFQETWLRENDDITPFLLPSYNLVHQGKSCSEHGGLFTYIRDDFYYKIIDKHNNASSWEGLFIDIFGEQLNKQIHLGNIYRPPKNNNNNQSIEVFIEDFSPIVDKISRNMSHGLIVGDFNINLLQIQEREKFGDFFDFMCVNGFLPKITFPTRFAKKSCSLIDQIFCRFPEPYITFSSAVIMSMISDHDPCIVSINLLKTKLHNPKFVKLRKFSEDALQHYKEEISNSDTIKQIKNGLSTDPNTTFNVLLQFLSEAKDKHFPEKTVRFNKYKHKVNKWITAGILHSIQYRDNLYKKLKLLCPESIQYQREKLNLKAYNNILSRSIRIAKKDYFINEFEKYKNDIRKTWDTLKSILNKPKVKSKFPSFFLINGKQETDMRQIANHFNNYFTNVGSQVDEIDTSNKQPFTSYLGPPCNFAFSFEYTNSEKIAKIIQNLKPKASSGPDGQSSKLLKAIGSVLAPTLSVIINQSLYTGIFPDKLKVAKVLPLYKMGENWLMENYRPISLLSTLSKVFERVVFEQLYEYLHSKNLLYRSQYGFRKDHSTELASVELIDHICKEMDKGDTPFSIFLDLSKAFDMLDHDILVTKLKHYGIDNTPLTWFKSYLTNRMQFVEIEGTGSNLLHIEKGVPQGSILGPLLFIIYINDIHKSSM